MTGELKIAFVQDALPFQGGAEKVLAAALEVYPEAPVYTLIYNREAFRGTIFERRPVCVSFIDRLPGARQFHRFYLPLMPFAVERFDLRKYDVIFSFSYAVAHAAPTRPGQLHISYIHTPMRYAWRHISVNQASGHIGSLTNWVLKPYFALFRLWDLAVLNRTDTFLTNSQWMAGNIWKNYHRHAEVLYPPVDSNSFYPQSPRGDYFICLARLAGLKRVDIIVQAFTRLGFPLLVVGEGPEKTRLQAIAGSNIRFLGWQSQENLTSLMGKAKAFVHAAEEDFGIALAEAQAAGCPVITLNQGAAPEIIRDGKTGLLYQGQDVDNLCAAVLRFEGEQDHYHSETIRANALRFDRQFFKCGLKNLVNEKWTAHQDQIIGRQMGSSLYLPDTREAPAR
jgi:glycosyltransferase involved in cell wall biosynthesis